MHVRGGRRIVGAKSISGHLEGKLTDGLWENAERENLWLQRLEGNSKLHLAQ